MVEAHLVWPITKQYLIWLIWFDNHDCHYFDQQQPKLESETCLSPDPNRLTTLNLTRVFQKFTKKKIPLGRLYSITISHVSWQFVNHAHVFFVEWQLFLSEILPKKNPARGRWPLRWRRWAADLSFQKSVSALCGETQVVKLAGGNPQDLGWNWGCWMFFFNESFCSKWWKIVGNVQDFLFR